MARAYILGDSHVVAIQRAIKLRSGGKGAPPFRDDLFVSRFAVAKKDKLIEGVSMAEADVMLRGDAGAMLVSLIGGNQFNIFGMMQHPVAFDFFEPSLPELPPADDARIVPVAMLEAHFAEIVAAGDGDKLLRLRAATTGPVYHMLPPPPKEDDAFVLSKADSYFRENDIATLGVTPGGLRLKLWRVQARMTERFCRDHGIVVLHPPAAALAPPGFLAPDFYGKDATHANGAYGELLLAQILALKREAEAVAA